MQKPSTLSVMLIVLVLLPGGTFEMGATVVADALAHKAEGPVHAVTLAPFPR